MRSIQLTALLLVHIICYAQRGTNSIYSYYGIGDIQLSSVNGFSGMAGAPVSMRAGHALNDNNPASYTGLRQRQFMMELSLGGHSTSHVTREGAKKSGDFTFQSLAVAFNAGPKYTTGVSLKPFSRVDYLITTSRQYPGLTGKIDEQVEGSGGVYQAAWSNAFLLNKRQSIGISTGFLFGSINSRQDVFGNSSSGTATFIIEKNKFLRQFFWKIGAISEHPVGKSTLAIGATFQPAVSLVSTEETYLKDGSDNTLYQETDKQGRFAFPSLFSSGISVSSKRNVFSLDYSSQLWGNSYRGTDFTSQNSSRIWAGYMHKKIKHYFMNEVEGTLFQAGAYFERNYLQIRGNNINQYGVTAGISLPNNSHVLRYNISVEVGERGVAVYPLVKEKFFKLGVAMSFRGLMMNPRVRYYD